MCDPRSTPTPSSELTAETRASLYALLANAWRYPEASSVCSFLPPAALESAFARMDSWPSAVTTAIKDLVDACGVLARQPRAAFMDNLRAAHVRLFGHSVRGGCPPYELEYGRGEIIQQTAELADLCGFYSAFGLQLTESAYERADHLAVECEFLSVLCVKEAWGQRNGNRDLSETCADAQRLFLRDHLAKWLPAFAQRVKAGDSGGFYGRMASLALAFIDEECRRFEIEVGPQWLELRPADPDRDSTIDCDTGACGGGATDGLVQLGMGIFSGQSR